MPSQTAQALAQALARESAEQVSALSGYLATIRTLTAERDRMRAETDRMRLALADAVLALQETEGRARETVSADRQALESARHTINRLRSLGYANRPESAVESADLPAPIDSADVGRGPARILRARSARPRGINWALLLPGFEWSAVWSAEDPDPDTAVWLAALRFMDPTASIRPTRADSWEGRARINGRPVYHMAPSRRALLARMLSSALSERARALLESHHSLTTARPKPRPDRPHMSARIASRSAEPAPVWHNVSALGSVKPWAEPETATMARIRSRAETAPAWEG